MQVYVPLNTPGVTYEDTRRFSLGVASVLERRSPELVVTDMKKHLRRHKVLVDWSQNERHKTTVCVYSLRAMERPTVSTPLHWHEVEAVVESDDPAAVSFTSAEVLERVAEHGDLFAPVLSLEQALPR
jgi:bifunctional non-homologous end joining protein LigD